MKYLIALIISLAGIASSYYFLKPQEWAAKSNALRVPIATLVDQTSDVKRKGRGKLIWIGITKGDELYEGDSVQTTQAATATIEFIDSKAQINIEPATTVLVEKSDNDVKLDVLTGGLFVKNSAETSGGQIKVKSGNKTVDVGKGDVSFNVSKKGELGVSVYKGKVSANVNGKSIELKTNESGNLSSKGIKKSIEKLLDLTPSYGTTLYLTPSKKVVTFKWKKLKENLDLNLYIGPSKNIQNKVSKDKILLASNGQMKVKLDIGDYYWQLKGYTSENDLVQSQVNKLQLKSKLSPRPIYPVDNEAVSFRKNEENKVIKLQWQARSPLSKAVVQIALDPKFTNIIKEEETTKNNIIFKEQIRPGTYYWRLRGFLKNSVQTASINTQSFEVKFFNNIFPPKLLSPTKQNKFILSENEKKMEMDFIWNRVNKAENYHLIVEKLNSTKVFKYDKMIKSPQIQLKGLRAGTYAWKVASVDASGKESKYSQTYKFQIKRPSRLRWKRFDADFQYVEDTDFLTTKWEQSPGATRWNVLISKNADVSGAKKITVDQTSWNFKPKDDGLYYIRVLALDADDQMLSKTSIKQITFKKRPLPKAPLFSSSVPKKLKATSSGKFKLRFRRSKIKNSTYQVKIKNLKGVTIRQVRMEKTAEVISGMMPGRYWVSATIQDQYGRTGPESETLELLVPKESKVKAPKINNIIIQ